MKIFLRILLLLLLALVLAVGTFYFVSCGPLNDIRAQQQAASFRQEAEDLGLGGHLSYHSEVDPKGSATVTITADLAGLDRSEMIEAVRLMDSQRGEGPVPVRQVVPRFEVDGAQFSDAREVDPGIFEAVIRLAYPGSTVERVRLQLSGRMISLTFAPCVDADCRVARAAPLLAEYVTIVDRQLQLSREHDAGHEFRLCLRLFFGEERINACTLSTADAPELATLRAVLESGETNR